MGKQLRVLMFLGLAWGAVFPNASGAQDSTEAAQKREDDSQLVEGLRRRRLFELAELYCRNQLKSPNLDGTSQVTMVVELMKTQTAKAMLAPAEQRAAQWQSIQGTSSDFARMEPDHPRKFLVAVQVALSHLAHGRLLRQEIAADMAPESARDQALQEIRTSRALLSDLRRKIDKAIPDQRARSLGEHDLSVQQLLNLNNNIRYQLAVCNLIRAQLYDATDRLNRIDALNGVTERLIEVQRETSEGQPLWWKTKIGQLECLRLLGKSGEARALIESWPTKMIPVATIHAVLEQKIRLAIELGDESFSRSLLEEVKKLTSSTAPLDLALIELSVDLAARATTDQRKQEWLNFGSEAARIIEQKHGSYWGRRADLVLIESAGGIPIASPPDKGPIKMVNPATPIINSAANTELDQLIRLAEDAVRKERWDDAIKAYGFAATKARSLGSADQALRLDVRLSQILEKQGNHALAANRLIDSAKQNFSLSIASAAHLRGCWNYAKTMSDQQTNGKRVLQDFLTDHVRTWPTEASANQARIWLASQYQSDQNWQTAFDTYLQVAIDSPFLPTAVEQSFDCAKTILLEHQRSGKSTQVTVSQLIAQLAEKQTQLVESDPASMQLELYRAELDLIFGSHRPNADLAQRLTSIESAADASLANNARAIHAVSICLDAPQRARQVSKRLGTDLNSLGLCERCLAAVIQSSNLKSGLENALELRLSVIEQVLQAPAMNEPKNSAHRITWLSRKSATLTGLHRHADSIVVLTELETEYPNSSDVQMQLARAMTAQHRMDAPEKPLAKWRQVAARLKSGTPNWYEAKFMVARLLFESGQKTEAAKLLKYIRVIPGWEKSELKPKFEQLLKSSMSGKETSTSNP